MKTLYRTEPRGRPKATDPFFADNVTLVEERVILVRARSFDEAITKAEEEARQYARARHRNPYGQEIVTRYLEYCDAYGMSLGDPRSGVEVYSETEIVPTRVSDSRVLARSIGYQESAAKYRRRRNFLNILFTAPAPGVRLTKKELAFVERLATLRRGRRQRVE